MRAVEAARPTVFQAMPPGFRKAWSQSGFGRLAKDRIDDSVSDELVQDCPIEQLAGIRALRGLAGPLHLAQDLP